MGRTKKQVTLEDTTIAALESEGGGNLGRGIENVYRDWARGVTPTTLPQPKRTAKADEPEVPFVHKATARAEARKAEAEAARMARLRASMPVDFRDVMENAKGESWMVGTTNQYIDAGIPREEVEQCIADLLVDEDGSIAAKAEAARIANAEYIRHALAESEANRLKALNGTKPDPTVQKLRLSVAALKGLGLFGTPADMPDDVIAAENEHFAKSPEEQAAVFGGEDTH